VGFFLTSKSVSIPRPLAAGLLITQESSGRICQLILRIT
jgi:hypothetical protein